MIPSQMVEIMEVDRGVSKYVRITYETAMEETTNDATMASS